MPSSSFSPQDLQVLYEDNHLIGVFKPSGVLTQGDSSGAESLMDVVKAWLKEKHRKPGKVFLGLLHRLDRNVSGVVLFAKTSKGASRLSEQFRSREVRKVYRAWVEGTPPAQAELTDYLSAEAVPRVEVRSAPAPGFKKASLSYRKLAADKNTTQLEIELHTGRKHQIRAQLSHFGHPILGDQKYGATLPSKEGGIALVSFRLEFSHPTQPGKRIVVELPCAK